MMSNAVLHRIYLHGYQRGRLPRWMRRIGARTELHRAWLSGFHGRFEQAGVSYGPANPYPPFESVDQQKTEWSDHLVRYGLPPG